MSLDTHNPTLEQRIKSECTSASGTDLLQPSLCTHWPSFLTLIFILILITERRDRQLAGGRDVPSESRRQSFAYIQGFLFSLAYISTHTSPVLASIVHGEQTPPPINIPSSDTTCESCLETVPCHLDLPADVHHHQARRKVRSELLPAHADP